MSFLDSSRRNLVFAALLVGAFHNPSFAQDAAPVTPENTATPVAATGATATDATSAANTTGRANAAAAINQPPANTSTAVGDAKTVAAKIEAPKTPPALPQRGTYSVTGNSEMMTVFAVSTDAQELLTALAAKANLRLVVDDSVARKLTINIIDRPARQIVDDIASAFGLSVADVEGVTMISEGIPRSPSSYLLSDIDSIPTKYVDAANARNLLPVFLQDYVKVNAEQNAVVLSAPRGVLRKFRDDIAQFDIPASQILVDLLLVELTDSTVDQLGINLNYNNGGNSFSLSPGIGSTIVQTITKLPTRFFFDLRALEERGKARVRANPRIATVSGRRASIFVGRQRYVATPLDSGRNFIDAGVRLGITPYTGGQKQVLVDVDAEVSTLSALDPITRLPEKSTRTANTSVRVGDGQTIVIGGLKQQESRDIRTKVPILGDLPILGSIFRTKDRRTTNTELVLFITPRILSDTGHLPDAEEKILKEQFLNADLNRALPPLPPVKMPLDSGASGAIPQGAAR